MDNTQPHAISSIKSPEKWDLALRITSVGLEYTLCAPMEENSMINGCLNFDLSTENSLRRVENTFYDLPLLVDDYNRVKVVFDTTSFLIIPKDVNSEDDHRSLFSYTFPEFEGDLISIPLKHCDAQIILGIEKGIKAFLERTYANLYIAHSLNPLIDFFMKRALLSNVNKMYVTLIGNKAYVTASANGNLLLANVFDYQNIDDVAFFILSLWKNVNFDALTDEIQIAGDNNHRQELMSILRKYIAFVMPSLFPSSLLKINRDAMNISFDLMLLSLCE